MTTLFTDHNSYAEWRDGIPAGKTIGFVPTMGALHEGHLSLIRVASAQCDYVVVSIYVNDLQFGSENDYQHYPRTQTADVQLCSDVHVSVVFAPLKSQIFPDANMKLLQPSSAADNFEGADRPGHFAGVVTVVDRLFSVVRPTHAYFGIKDYQQVAVINHMSNQLHPEVQITVCETERELDGLALSSRNRFLSQRARSSASLLPKALTTAIKNWEKGTTQANALIDEAHSVLAQDPMINVQYISIVRAGSMDQVQTVGSSDVIIAAGGLVAVPPPEAMMPASLMSGLVRGVTVKFITEGDADPQAFIPQMLDWYKAGKFPFDRLIKTFPFDQINEAAHASEDGSAIKPVLTF